MKKSVAYNPNWMEECYQPAFSYTVDDILNWNQCEDSPRESKFEHVSKYDPDSIRKVYEKVRIMNELAETIENEPQTNKIPKPKVELRSEPTQISRTDTGIQEDTCIWDAGELSVLRSNSKKVQEENRAMRAKCKELELRNKHHERIIKEQNEGIASNEKVITDAKKANMRLKIRCDNLQSEVELCNAKLSALGELTKEISDEKNSIMKIDHNIKCKFDKERLAFKKLEMKLDNMNKEVELDKQAAIDRVKNEYRKTVHDLSETIKNLTLTVEKERIVHSSTKRGLDQLRKHYACLPLDRLHNPNAVTADEVNKFSY